jgi:glucose/arabinose dehydrogenase
VSEKMACLYLYLKITSIYLLVLLSLLATISTTTSNVYGGVHTGGIDVTPQTVSVLENKTHAKFFGCTDYGDTIHCDPLINELKSYIVPGLWSKIYTSSAGANPILVDGKYGKALEMRANRLESVEVNNTKSINPQSFSISFWIKKLPASNPTGTIVSHSNFTNTAGWAFQMSSNGNVSFGVNNAEGNVTSASTTITAVNNTEIQSNKFNQIIGTFDGSLVKIYKDGELAAVGVFEGKYYADPKTPLRVGGVAGSMGESLWTGVIDDLRMYNRTLAKDEVKRIFLSNSSSSIPSPPPHTILKGLVSHWTFDSSSKLSDTSVYRNDGILRTLIASMAFAPDGRLFFSEKNTGEIKIMTDNKVLLKPFVKISDYYVDAEQGLLGLAVDPLFERNHFVYLYYVAITDSNKIVNRLLRFTEVNNTAVDKITIIDNIPAARGYHSGGALAFGPDDKLYLGVGDATNHIFAQNPSVLLGKVLRINRDGTIPVDNPYPNSPVYTRGHRNMYGIAFDHKNGFGIIAENGDAFYDEINLIKKGGNYGFPTLQPPNIAPELANSSLSVLPVRSYWRTPAPTQTIYYEGNKFPELKGRFLFGTFDGNIYALKFANDRRVIEDEKIALRLYPYSSVIALAQSPDGEIYFGGDGIYKLISIGSSHKDEVLFPIEVNSPTDFKINKLQVNTDKSRMLVDFESSSSPSKLTKTADTTSPYPLLLSIKFPKRLLDGVYSVINMNNNSKREHLDFTLDNSSTSFTIIKIKYLPSTIYHLEILGEKISSLPLASSAAKTMNKSSLATPAA